MFLLCCPCCGNTLYDPVKRLCPSVPEESQADLFCKQCHWIGRADDLVRREMGVEMGDEVEEETEMEEEEEFRWEIPR